jgi:hypothetical protein
MNNVLAVAPALHFRACLRVMLERPFEKLTLPPPFAVTVLPLVSPYVTSGNINAE